MQKLSQYELKMVDLDRLLAVAQSCDVDDSPAMGEIIIRFEPLTKRLARSITEDHFLRDDLANAARLALVHAVRRHDLTRQGFPAFAELYMRGAVFREYRALVTPSLELTLDESDLPTEPAEEGKVFEIETMILERLAPWGDGAVAAAIDSLSPDQLEVVERRYIDDADLATIANERGITVSAVSQRLMVIHRNIEDELGRPRSILSLRRPARRNRDRAFSRSRRVRDRDRRRRGKDPFGCVRGERGGSS